MYIVQGLRIVAHRSICRSILSPLQTSWRALPFATIRTVSTNPTIRSVGLHDRDDRIVQKIELLTIGNGLLRYFECSNPFGCPLELTIHYSYMLYPLSTCPEGVSNWGHGRGSNYRAPILNRVLYPVGRSSNVNGRNRFVAGVEHRNSAQVSLLANPLSDLDAAVSWQDQVTRSSSNTTPVKVFTTVFLNTISQLK